VEILLAPLRQTLEVTAQALACRDGLWLQRPRLVEVSLKEGHGARTLVLITPLGIQIHADDRERPSGEFGQGAEFFGKLHGSLLACRCL